MILDIYAAMVMDGLVNHPRPAGMRIIDMPRIANSDLYRRVRIKRIYLSSRDTGMRLYVQQVVSFLMTSAELENINADNKQELDIRWITKNMEKPA